MNHRDNYLFTIDSLIKISLLLTKYLKQHDEANDNPHIIDTAKEITALSNRINIALIDLCEENGDEIIDSPDNKYIN